MRLKVLEYKEKDSYNLLPATIPNGCRSNGVNGWVNMITYWELFDEEEHDPRGDIEEFWIPGMVLESMLEAPGCAPMFGMDPSAGWTRTSKAASPSDRFVLCGNEHSIQEELLYVVMKDGTRVPMVMYYG